MVAYSLKCLEGGVFCELPLYGVLRSSVAPCAQSYYVSLTSSREGCCVEEDDYLLAILDCGHSHADGHASDGRTGNSWSLRLHCQRAGQRRQPARRGVCGGRRRVRRKVCRNRGIHAARKRWWHCHMDFVQNLRGHCRLLLRGSDEVHSCGQGGSTYGRIRPYP